MAALGRNKHSTRIRNTCVRSILYMSTSVVLPETIDLSDEQFGRQIPFETFAALRANAPIYWYAPGNCWVVTSYDLVERVNRDYRRFSNEGGIIGKDFPTSASSRSWLISPKKLRMSNSATNWQPSMKPVRSSSIACVADRLGRNPYEHGTKSASKWAPARSGRLPGHPVTHRRNAKRPLAALRFRDVHAPGGRGTVPALAEIALKPAEHPAHPIPFLHIRQGDPIHPGGPAIGPDPLPRLPQDVTPVNTVVKGVETPLRRLPGRSP